jgi:hypothetical protein
MLTPLRRDWVRPDYRILDRHDQAAGASQRHCQGLYFRGLVPDPREYRILLPAGNPPAGCVSSPRTDPGRAVPETDDYLQALDKASFVNFGSISRLSIVNPGRAGVSVNIHEIGG